MYNPSAFLITTGALTSIFNFFFGEYFRERERTYRLWLRIFAYDDRPAIHNPGELCAVMEAKERMYRQARMFLTIMLLTLVGTFMAFQLYSLPYIDSASPNFQTDARNTWIIFSVIIGVIVFINMLEMLYIRLAFVFRWRYPFFQARQRVTGLARVSMIWQALECPGRKRASFNKNRIPAYFYNHLDDPREAFEHCFLASDFNSSYDRFFKESQRVHSSNSNLGTGFSLSDEPKQPGTGSGNDDTQE
ncbi:MAG: hypothetical protein KKB70_01315 [Proteobacteria bacterium]|nr:hypothetical protein [Pseudomonadota bacterium]MBU1610600.1 hypothetical protein [Pseudomonadota bacterium]